MSEYPVLNSEMLMLIVGNLDSNLNIINEKFNVDCVVRDNKILINGSGSDIEKVKTLFDVLTELNKMKIKFNRDDLSYVIDMVKLGKEDSILKMQSNVVCITSQGKSIKPKTLGQERYIEAIKKDDIVFGIGPAGTGKTYLAMAMAAQAFKNKEVSRIILTRPAVEAGENLGFLPGDLQEKVNPYLRPVYDALYEILGYDTCIKYIEKGYIEVAPLAYMRGRTLDKSYIILDEAQNTTNEQMKMFLTRMGFGSKVIVTGDITQVDLPKGKSSGLKTIPKILRDVKGISFVYLTRSDIVRHPLVQRIIDAYEKNSK